VFAVTIGAKKMKKGQEKKVYTVKEKEDGKNIKGKSQAEMYICASEKVYKVHIYWD
jgi:hypothetical protein